MRQAKSSQISLKSAGGRFLRTQNGLRNEWKGGGRAKKNPARNARGTEREANSIEKIY